MDREREQIMSVVVEGEDSRLSLPQTLVGLLSAIELGIDRLELVERAYRKGLRPIWERSAGDHHQGQLILVCHDRRWILHCRLQPVKVH